MEVPSLSISLADSIEAGHDLIPLYDIPVLKGWTGLQLFRARTIGKLPAIRVPGKRPYLSTPQAVVAWLVNYQPKAKPKPEKPQRRVSSRLAKHGL